MKVRDVMTKIVITVEPTTPFKETAERMLDFGVSGLPVLEDGRLVGVVTEADLMSKEAFDGRHQRPLEVLVGLLTGERRWTDKAMGLTAGEIMTVDLVTAGPDEDLHRVARRMLERGVKRLPVLEDGRLVGIVSRHDLIRLFRRPDAEIATEIETKLASVRFAPEDHRVTAAVNDGVVTLTGRVRRPGDVAVIEGLARNVPGVVGVEDHVVYELTYPA